MKIKEKYIYKITNKVNQKSYIGQTVNPKRRFLEHIKGYCENDHSVVHLAIKKYGVDNFTFEIIDKGKNYNELERHYIEKFDTLKNGYNLTFGGDAPPVWHGENHFLCSHSLDTVNLVKHLLKNTNMSTDEIAKATNYNKSSINRINNGQLWKTNGQDYPIRKRILFTSEEVDQIIKLLSIGKLKHKEIAEKFNVARSTITAINRGVLYKRDNVDYPIRKNKVI